MHFQFNFHKLVSRKNIGYDFSYIHFEHLIVNMIRHLLLNID